MVRILICGILSMSIFCPVFPIEMYKRLTTLFLHAFPPSFPSGLLVWDSAGPHHEEVQLWRWNALLIRRLRKVVSTVPIHNWEVYRHLARNMSLLEVVNLSYLPLLAAPCYRPACQLQFGIEE